MKTDRNENIRRRGRTFEIAISAGTNPTTGKRIRITRSARTIAEAREIRDRLRVQVRDGIDADPGSVTVAAYLRDRWLPHMRSQVRVRTWFAPRPHRAPRDPEDRLRQACAAAADACAFRHRCDARGRERASHGAARAPPLSSALRQAVRWKLLAVNPAEAAAPPRPSRPTVTVPTGSEIARLIEAMPTPYRVPTMIAATTGLRLGEVLALRWDAIDLEAAHLRVVATLQQDAGQLFVESPKTIARGAPCRSRR